MGRDSTLFRLLSQVDFEEIRLKERKQPAPGSTGGRKKKAAKKAAPAKTKEESKGKEKITFSEPPQQTEDEESASLFERTDTEKTEDDRSVNEDDNSAQSPNGAGPHTNPETTEGGEEDDEEEGDKEAGNEGGDKEKEEAEEAEADRISRKLLQGVKKRAESIEELYLEWHDHRYGTPYREILPGHTDVECIQRLEEVEDLIMNLTNSNTLQEIDTFPEHCPTPPQENAASKDSDERADPNLTGQSPPPQPEVPASDFTKEWVEDRLQKLEASTSELIDNRIQEFEDSAVQPFKDRSIRIFDSALKFTDATRCLLERNQERFSKIGEDLREEAVQRSKCVQRTAILEDLTSELKGDFDRFEREPDQRLTSMSDDLVGTTLERVSELEKKNVDLVAELKALSEQVAELLRVKVNADAAAVEADAQVAKRVQDALDAEAGKEKEAPRSTHLTEEEEEAARMKRGEALFPGFAKRAAALAAEDAERLEREARRLEGYVAENKKKKAATSTSAPKKRKREAPKKAQIADLLDEVTETVITSTSQQADQVEEEVEEQLQSRKWLICSDSLEYSGLKKYLSGHFIFHEKEVRELFKSATMVGDSILKTVNETIISFDEAAYAEFFELPSEGHTFNLHLPAETIKKMKTVFSTDSS
ncbi:titin-like [Impatiens glandulifera]|uniref:titin-like n=1 Tax=Impatiens glandulifera TaxID=253017 RepID=UPI001FB1448E|nr:titin-like [Impatiens glandulifera]